MGLRYSTGGVFAAYAIQLALSKKGLPFDLQLVTNPSDADIFIDDLIDSGRTLERFCEAHTERPFFALFDKREGVYGSNWVSFPWEQNEAEETVDDNIVRLLQYIGESPNREGLQETPARAVKAWDFWTKGYSQKPEDVLKVFEDGADGYDGMVIVKDIPLYSKCEHHMADIFGTATIAYIPNGKIVGLSKLSRLLDVFARRLQVQERLTCQVANAIDEHLNPLGVGVVIKARHMCMESRGICQQGHQTITCALRGVLKDDPSARAEFMALAK
jgi:GTP cyclohydrolase I